MVKSKHILLLVADGGDRNVIPRPIKLVADRTGTECNQKKERHVGKGVNAGKGITHTVNTYLTILKKIVYRKRESRNGERREGSKNAQTVDAGCPSSRFRLMMADRHQARFTM
jgi:hypothetical protein